MNNENKNPEIEKIGSISKRFEVYKDPYFPRNQILIGYKGGSFLETGLSKNKQRFLV
jgi:hypothetical protein